MAAFSTSEHTHLLITIEALLIALWSFFLLYLSIVLFFSDLKTMLKVFFFVVLSSFLEPEMAVLCHEEEEGLK